VIQLRYLESGRVGCTYSTLEMGCMTMYKCEHCVQQQIRGLPKSKWHIDENRVFF
jgi:hypothetical protein